MHVRCPFGLHSLQRGDEKTLRQVFVGHQVRWLRGRLQSITIYIYIYILLFAGNAMVQVGFFQHWMVHLVYLTSISHRTANLWIYGARKRSHYSAEEDVSLRACLEGRETLGDYWYWSKIVALSKLGDFLSHPPFFPRIFHEINHPESSYWGTTILGNHP
jgi:hypothetical protein